MIDDELEEAMKDLPDIPCVFVSAVAGKGLTELKDILWEEINKEPS